MDTLSDIKVLIVDDHEPMRDILTAMLKTAGADEIREAINGEEALEILAEFEADLVITDERMTPVSGVDLTRAIRAGVDGGNPYLPVIMVTGHAERPLLERARDAGVHEFLAKPVSASMLYARLQRVIENPPPFVRSDTYFGPDRRRRAVAFTGPDRRKYRYEYPS
jgi:CheY-like chemotaxis protein